MASEDTNLSHAWGTPSFRDAVRYLLSIDENRLASLDPGLIREPPNLLGFDSGLSEDQHVLAMSALAFLSRNQRHFGSTEALFSALQDLIEETDGFDPAQFSRLRPILQEAIRQDPEELLRETIRRAESSVFPTVTGIFGEVDLRATRRVDASGDAIRGYVPVVALRIEIDEPAIGGSSAVSVQVRPSTLDEIETEIRRLQALLTEAHEDLGERLMES
jgi:hypothetical protein